MWLMSELTAAERDDPSPAVQGRSLKRFSHALYFEQSFS
jgi:hypothetical protein